MPKKLKPIKANRVEIPVALFEIAGWRSITLAYGEVVYPDGRPCRFNVRLHRTANDTIQLIAEDINRDGSFAKALTLRRRH